MQIVIRAADNGAGVQVVNPATNEVLDTRALEPGQDLTISLPNAHEAADVELGEVVYAEEGGEQPAQGEGDGDPA